MEGSKDEVVAVERERALKRRGGGRWARGREQKQEGGRLLAEDERIKREGFRAPCHPIPRSSLLMHSAEPRTEMDGGKGSNLGGEKRRRPLGDLGGKSCSFVGV